MNKRGEGKLQSTRALLGGLKEGMHIYLNVHRPLPGKTKGWKLHSSMILGTCCSGHQTPEYPHIVFDVCDVLEPYVGVIVQAFQQMVVDPFSAQF